MTTGGVSGGQSGTATATPTASPTGTLESPVPYEMFPGVPDWTLDLGAVVVVLVVAYFASRLVVLVFGRRIARRFQRPSLTRTAIRGIRGAVFLIALLSILRIYGLKLSDISLSVAVFSAVVGVVIAPVVGSIVSGVFLLADQPYEIGDMIELSDTDTRGFVEDITLRYTKIFTLDNTFIVIPNGTIRERDVINYSAEDPRTRLRLDITVTYEGDLDEARRIVERSARNVDAVIEGGPDIRVGAARYPAPPTCYINSFADHGVQLTLRYWVKEPYKLLATRSKVQTNVWAALEDADVEIAYPHSHLHFDDTSGQMRVAMEEGAPDAPSPDPDRDGPP